MLVIRLARTGKKHQAYFRLVVSDKRKTPTAKFVEILGSYDPHAKKFVINADKAKEYLKNGAVPSNSVAKLLKREGVELPKWVKITEKNKASKKKEEKKEEKKEAPKTEEAAAEGEATPDAPAEEVKDATEAPAEEAEAKEEENNNSKVEEAAPEGEAKEGE